VFGSTPSEGKTTSVVDVRGTSAIRCGRVQEEPADERASTASSARQPGLKRQSNQTA